MLQAAAGERPAITIFGDDYETPDGTCIRDYIHVVDLARAHVLALDACVGTRAYNLGCGGDGTTVKEVIAAAREVTGREIAVEVGARRPGDPARLVASSARAERDLGWRPPSPTSAASSSRRGDSPRAGADAPDRPARGAGIAIAAAGCQNGPELSESAQRGMKTYFQVCIACHNAKPSIEALGPPIAGSSRALIEAQRRATATYPRRLPAEAQSRSRCRRSRQLAAGRRSRGVPRGVLPREEALTPLTS